MDGFISALLERLLATSVQTVALASVVWMLCRLAPRLSPSSQCWLWWLVALQALVGLAAKPIELPWLPQVTAVPRILPDAPGNVFDQEIPVAGVAADQDQMPWQMAVVLLWTAGFLIMITSSMRDWLRGHALLKAASPCNDKRLSQALAHASAATGLKAPPTLLLSRHIDSPLLIGHIRPALLLPASSSLSDEELDMAFVHELTHVRRHDLWWGCIPSLARQVFFFNPFALLAVREYGIAREAACDAAAVTDRCRQQYGRLLVRLGASPEARTGLAVSSPTFRSLKRRLAMLQNTRFLSSAATIAVVAVVAAGIMPLRLVAAAGAPADVNAAAIPVQGGQQSRATFALLQAEGASLRNALANQQKESETAQALLTQQQAELSAELARLREVSANQANAATSTPGGVLDDYKVGQGDRLQIYVWQHPELSVDAPVRPDGKVSTPLVENMVAAGKTPTQLARDMEAALANFIRAPRVAVIVLSAAWVPQP